MLVEDNLHLQQLISLPLNTMEHEEHYGLLPASSDQGPGTETGRSLSHYTDYKTSMDLLKNNHKQLKSNEVILL